MIITIDTEKKEIHLSEDAHQFLIINELQLIARRSAEYKFIHPKPLQPVTESSTISQPVPYFGDEVLFV